MQTASRTLLFVLILGFALSSAPAFAQQIIGTVTVGVSPTAVAVDSVTNKIYVSNLSGTVTVIDSRSDSTTTVQVGRSPGYLAVNPATNKIYVSNGVDNTVTVIDGATQSTTTVPVGRSPNVVAVNSVTNKIYVTDQDDNKVTVIDGPTLSTVTVPVGHDPLALAVNPITNKVYVANYFDNSITVIDGASNGTTTVSGVPQPRSIALNLLTGYIYVANYLSQSVTKINASTLQTSSIAAGTNPFAVAVNAVTNKIYVTNELSNNVTVIDGTDDQTTQVAVGSAPNGVAIEPVSNKVYVSDSSSHSVTMIDGASNATTNITVGNSPKPIAVNSVTNRIYVGNTTDGTVTVIGGASVAPLQFIPVTPCRLIDTRPPLGGGPIQGGTSQNFIVPQLGGCNIPSTAAAYSLNVTTVPSGRLGFLTIWPAGEDQPIVSTMNSLDDRIKADAAIVPAGYQGAVSVYVNNTSNLLLDIDGYFIPANGSSLQYYPMVPCRVVDTRGNPGPLGGPFLNANQERDFPVLDSACIPQGPSIKAYSFNVTAVPHPAGQRLGFLTVWPQGESQPVVSTLNNPTGTVVANAAIVPAGSGGGVAVFPNNNTDLLIDISGYFAAPGSGGLSLYPAAPCRALDTRQVGNGAPFTGELTVDVAGSPCAPPSTAQAYVFNATVVPPGHFGFLTLWPDGEAQPSASTLNATDGAITSNMAIVQTTNGKIDAFASNLTQLLLDISSYFAP